MIYKNFRFRCKDPNRARCLITLDEKHATSGEQQSVVTTKEGQTVSRDVTIFAAASAINGQTYPRRQLSPSTVVVLNAQLPRPAPAHSLRGQSAAITAGCQGRSLASQSPTIKGLVWLRFLECMFFKKNFAYIECKMKSICKII